ncbi:MAG: carboxypeptidase regulatory-like domain-containing protein [Gemmatimonadetes bacterium]|nr:carboxypeptidase regulatory-like domain-containing protein [Gemmatimonadota bacterium]MYD24447.1 carboxypeptidase regulatory-like domain-containing protein [Gemmatimonadota bacterium]MYJ00011.1 carboxypeptidase regulatory-like domain-containing protein [Gemmatimonadota bacterium]
MKYRPLSGPSGLFVYGALLAAWAALAVCVFCPVRTAQAQGTGSIGLTVVNGTTGQPMAGHEVVLLNHSAEEGPDQTLARVVTDGDGRYEFTGLRADGSHYVVATRYLEIPYLTGHIPLVPGTGRIDTLLQVFEITTDETALVHSAVHLVIDAGPEILNVTEIIVVENRGILTFAPPPGVGLGLVYNLPAAAFGLQPMMEGLQHTERGLLFSAPVPPGVSRVVYAYNVDRASIDHRFNRQMDYDIERVQVLVSPSTQTVTVTNLTNDGVQQIAADEYLLLSNRVGVGRGMSVEVAFPSVLAWQDVMKWGMLGFVVLIVAAGLVVGIRVKPEQPAEPPALSDLTPEDERKYAAIVQALAALDDQFAAGGLDPDAYGTRRARLKDRALRLRQPGSGDG